MFCIDPAHGPCSNPRQSPKSFQVNESGPKGTRAEPNSPPVTGQPAVNSTSRDSKKLAGGLSRRLGLGLGFELGLLLGVLLLGRRASRPALRTSQ